MNGGRRIPLLATLSALSPVWATLVAAGVPGLVIFVVFLNDGFVFALTAVALFAAFIATVSLTGARRALTRSPQLRQLPFQDRRMVMASVMHGGENVDPALAPAVEEQAARVLDFESGARRALVMLWLACGLNALGFVLAGVEGDPITVTRVWPVVLLVALVAFAWVREPRRIALARSALAAARRSTGAGQA